uniref:Actin-related protein 3 n=1 Tax=Leptocylindrus danicus TaxID=163516 RepID=A0A6U2SMS1_9STRA|mmetsp:Transcript_6521/g.9628  ORF Transcript_6521/g.9628 Transcript_6521/m.9628 type:complete len:413 (+) Transcript_6521:1097-2335(+)
MEKPAVVIDTGSGFTKIGFAGNTTPLDIIPTTLSTRSNQRGADQLTDLDIFVGNDCVLNNVTHQSNYLVRNGLVEDWNAMERLWHRCIYDEIRCNPEEHCFLLTEPPLNPPENREQLAEIMFETFNVPGLYIAVQAVLAIAASWTSPVSSNRDLSGLVVDSGDGLTHIIPVADGHVIGSGIRQIPLAGRDVTNYILQQMRERKEPIPPEESLEAARIIKEHHCYVCPNASKEVEKYESNPEKYTRQYHGVDAPTGQKWACNVMKERFMSAEILFSPLNLNYRPQMSLPQVIDSAIQNCPVDVRRTLYGNIVLSGGNTMFKDFGRRLQRDLNCLVKTRIDQNMNKIAHTRENTVTAKVDVGVLSHSVQDYAVWFGGSMLASTAQFRKICCTKQQYEEEGPRLVRQNIAFQAQF